MERVSIYIVLLCNMLVAAVACTRDSLSEDGYGYLRASVLRDDNIRCLQRLNDLQTFMKRDDRFRLIRGNQLVCANPHDQYVGQATGVINHSQVIIMEHVERSRCINYSFILKHNRLSVF